MQSFAHQKSIFSIKQLTPNDLEIFKSIRLEALHLEPHLFGSNFERESLFSDQDLLEVLTDITRSYFALKVAEIVVGVTGIMTSKENSSQAILIASYIRSEYRRKGGSELLYEARLDWAKKSGFAEVIVSHRASNEASRKANQKYDFVFTHSMQHTWNDGAVEDENFYRLKL